MQSITFGIVCVFVFLCSVSALRNCGEFEKDEIIHRILEEDAKPLPYQNEIDQLFDAYDKDDSHRMEEIYQLLANVTKEDSESTDYSEYAANRIRYVVSSFVKMKNWSEFK